MKRIRWGKPYRVVVENFRVTRVVGYVGGKDYADGGVHVQLTKYGWNWWNVRVTSGPALGTVRGLQNAKRRVRSLMRRYAMRLIEATNK